MSEDAKIMAKLKSYWKEMYEVVKEVDMDDKHAPEALTSIVAAI